MFGNQSLEPYPETKRTLLINTIQETIRHILPRRLQNGDVLKSIRSVVVPRYGGRMVFLWLKGKTRVWIDRENVWISKSLFPSELCGGTLLQAELFQHNTSWFIGWEDVLVKNNLPMLPHTGYLDRLRELQDIAKLIGFQTHPGMDTGIMIMKPIVNPSHLSSLFETDVFIIQPKFLLFYDTQSKPRTFLHPYSYKVISPTIEISSNITKTSKTSKTSELSELSDSHKKVINDTKQSIYEIRRNIETKEPDQFHLFDPETHSFIGDACIRSMVLSLWLRSIPDRTLVICRKFQERWEPFAPASYSSEPSASASSGCLIE
jgi:hypothetical protein